MEASVDPQPPGSRLDADHPENGVLIPRRNTGRRQIVDALVVAQVIVVGDEGFDPSLELAGQIVVLQQDAVLESLT